MPDPIVSLNEESLRADLGELVRRTVEDTLNGLPGEEAGDPVGAGRHGRTADREARRAGHCGRKPAATSGEAAIGMPKPKGMRFTTAIIERYRRRETSAGEATIETCLAGVPARRIEDVSEVPWGPGVSASTVSNPSEKAFEVVGAWRSRPPGRACLCVYADGIHLRRSRGGSYENVAAMVAVGVDDDGCREVIGAAEGFTGSSECWRESLPWLRSRGLRGVRMFAGDEAAGMAGPVAEASPGGRPPAPRGPLLRERAGEGAEDEAREGRGHAQGNPRHGVARGRRGQGRPRRPRSSGRPSRTGPPRSSWTAAPRPWRTPGSPASAGGGSGPTTPSSG